MPKKDQKSESKPEEEPVEVNEEAPQEEPKEEKTEVKEAAAPPKTKGHKIKDLAHKYWDKKKLTIPVTVLVLVVLIMLIPVTRYKILGLFIKKDFVVTVEDSRTHQIVSGAKVTLAGQLATSDSKGQAKLHVPVGQQGLTITKQYYQTSTGKQMVSLSSGKNHSSVDIVAQGRQVPVLVVDKVSGKPIEKAKVQALDTEASTDKDGKATIVLPTTSDTQKATVSADGYNNTDVNLNVTDQVVDANTVKLTPAGKLYFLSNASGKIDVVKTDLDGSNRQTVLAGTGKEDKTSTALLATKDWKYLALLSARDGSPKVFLINTDGDKLTTIDEGDADFVLSGWSGHTLVYRVNRHNVQSWQANQTALKSFNAESTKLSVLDQFGGTGTSFRDYMNRQLADVFLLGDKVYYTTTVGGSKPPANTPDQQASLMIANLDGSNRNTIKSFDNAPASGNTFNYLASRLGGPNEVYLQFNYGSTTQFFSLENGQLNEDSSVSEQSFNSTGYPTYLQSPSGKLVFWGDPRDGKTTLFVGDSDAKNPKQVASLSEYTPFGWYSDNYLLVQKSNSELYILPVDGSKPAQKITDYYKPNLTFLGYGGGYGGL